MCIPKHIKWDTMDPCRSKLCKTHFQVRLIEWNPVFGEEKQVAREVLHSYDLKTGKPTALGAKCLAMEWRSYFTRPSGGKRSASFKKNTLPQEVYTGLQTPYKLTFWPNGLAKLASGVSQLECPWTNETAAVSSQCLVNIWRVLETD
jgi:hypothetical protein